MSGNNCTTCRDSTKEKGKRGVSQQHLVSEWPFSDLNDKACERNPSRHEFFEKLNIRASNPSE